MAKETSVDLGKAQSVFEAASRNFKAARKLLDKAQRNFDAAKSAFSKAEEGLNGAFRTVIAKE